MPQDVPVHLIMDNDDHKTDKLKAWLAAHPRYQVHFTPTSTSWLARVERCFSTLSEQGIERQVPTRVRDLEESIRHDLDTHKANPRPFRGYRKAEDLLASVERAAQAMARNL